MVIQPWRWSVSSPGARARTAARTLAWIEQVAQAVADEVAAQHRQEDAQARHQGLPGIHFKVRVSIVEHAAPGRGWRRHTGAEEAQTCLGEDRRPGCKRSL